jgi:hypothetical protein
MLPNGDNEMRTLKFLLVGLFLFVPSLTIGEDFPIQVRSYSEAAYSNINLTYAGQAVILSNLLLKEKVHIDREVVTTMLKAIDANMPKFFPKGPFNRNDFIAIAWLESSFRQYEDGTHGEKGLFQIMPDEFAEWHVNPKYFYGVNTNTKMGFRVLSGKYKRWHDYKKTIIAYNGVVRLKNGKWSEKYWKAFLKRKEKVDLALPVK